MMTNERLTKFGMASHLKILIMVDVQKLKTTICMELGQIYKPVFKTI